ncbi:hypothetical protein B0O79_0392 [Flavobacteriaceae bacterium MAR_2009_75]|nr:hypothetical protein B0O79_0392 [Flavobacteriaceae bacterium MAR_2009_75]
MAVRTSTLRAKSPLIFIIFLVVACTQNSKEIVLKPGLRVEALLIHQDNFETDLNNWKIEQMEGGQTILKNKKLEIDDAAGCTIWFKEELEGPIMIEYDTFIINQDGPHDRVSDMNCFWMAKDMENQKNLFENSENRHGKFSNYDGLRLYYMGVGGHDNSKTRFRRYKGNGKRPLLKQHDFSNESYLLKSNTTYHIRIIAYSNIIQYYRNGVKMIDFYDNSPYTKGHFGFRTVNNHMTIDNFKVYKLENK